MSTGSTLAAVIFWFAIELVMPMMYFIYRVDKTVELRSIRRKYKIVSFPRSIFLAATMLSIIFAPTDAANSPAHAAVFIALAVAYGLCAIIDLHRAYKSAE